MHGTPLRLGPDDAGTALSADEFTSAEFQPPFIYERVRGKLDVLPPASLDDRRASRPFRRELGGYWGSHPELVDDIDMRGWVSTTPDDDRIPDICVYLAGERSDQLVPLRVPELVFEFVSGERSDQERDYIDKRAEYHAIGVREYVIVDRFKRSALVLTWAEEDFVERLLTRDQHYTTPLLPWLSVALAEVFAD